MKRILFLLIFLPSCLFRSHQQVVTDSYDHLTSIGITYKSLITSLDHEEMISYHARILGCNYAATLKESLYSMLYLNTYGVSAATPLHSCAVRLERDLNCLRNDKHALEKRSLHYNSVHRKIERLVGQLLYALCLIRTQQEYIQEEQFLANEKLQKIQIAQAQQQTRLLQELVDKENKKQRTNDTKD